MLDDKSEIKCELLSSLLLFTRYFYQIRTRREFSLSNPPGRECHFITVCRALTEIFYMKKNELMINIPPRYGKTELLIHFVAWSLAHYPDCNFIYISYAHTLAKKQTQTIKEIITLPQYVDLFDVHLKQNTMAKDNFETTAGGSVIAVGAGGSITGKGAGIKGCDRFGGALLFDDIIKPEDALSDTIREGRNNWYFNTAQSRINSPKTAKIGIAQRTHEADLPGMLISKSWPHLVLPALDEVRNPLYPEMHNRAALEKMEKESPYVYAAQYQQNPQPAGGGIFKPEWFVVLDEEPEILATFITADTAETDKTYNDATVFSFWGLYEIKERGILTGIYALHWLNCLEIRVEPAELESNFNAFLLDCMMHTIKPHLAAIEKKSTGVTLLSLLQKTRGITIIDIERTSASGNKAARYFEIQPYVSSKRISFTEGARHIDNCITHCAKITANNSHLHDDVADTLYDAIKIGLITKYIQNTVVKNDEKNNLYQALHSHQNQMAGLRKRAYYDNR